MPRYEFEVIEDYILHGERRFRLRVKGTRIVVNVRGDSLEEALEAAERLLDRVDLDKVLRKTP